ncbi:MAG: ATP-binding protein [Dehalococcoidia bacterium]|nr:ATP-binding protein [Dehalococcoidia bacterium]
MRRLQAELEERVARRREERLARGIACLSCDDTGVRPSGAFCSCARGHAARAEARQRWERSLPTALGIPPRLLRVPLEELERSPVWDAVRRWCDDRTPGRGIALVGPFGCGKSTLLAHLLLAMVRRAAERDPLPPPETLGAFYTLPGLLDRLRPRDDEADRLSLRRLQRIPWLAIDDIGAERLTPWAAERLFELLNERTVWERPVLVSSNLSIDELAVRWDAQLGDESGTRIAERLLESCAVVEWPPDAPNWRMVAP